METTTKTTTTFHHYVYNSDTYHDIFDKKIDNIENEDALFVDPQVRDTILVSVNPYLQKVCERAVNENYTTMMDKTGKKVKDRNLPIYQYMQSMTMRIIALVKFNLFFPEIIHQMDHHRVEKENNMTHIIKDDKHYYIDLSIFLGALMPKNIEEWENSGLWFVNRNELTQAYQGQEFWKQIQEEYRKQLQFFTTPNIDGGDLNKRNLEFYLLANCLGEHARGWSHHYDFKLKKVYVILKKSYFEDVKTIQEKHYNSTNLRTCCNLHSIIIAKRGDGSASYLIKANVFGGVFQVFFMGPAAGNGGDDDRVPKEYARKTFDQALQFVKKSAKRFTSGPHRGAPPGRHPRPSSSNSDLARRSTANSSIHTTPQTITPMTSRSGTPRNLQTTAPMTSRSGTPRNLQTTAPMTSRSGTPRNLQTHRSDTSIESKDTHESMYFEGDTDDEGKHISTIHTGRISRSSSLSKDSTVPPTITDKEDSIIVESVNGSGNTSAESSRPGSASGTTLATPIRKGSANRKLSATPSRPGSAANGTVKSTPLGRTATSHETQKNVDRHRNLLRPTAWMHEQSRSLIPNQ